MEPIGPTSHYFYSHRLKLHYVDWGNHDKPPLLLVHGGRDHARNWDWVALDLRRDYHVIAPDLRGHGDSDAPTDPAAYKDDAIAHDIDTLLGTLGVRDHDLVGYSMGARTAVRLLVRGARPRRAVLGGAGDALVLDSPILRPDRFDRLLATQGQSGVLGDAQTWAWAHHAGFDLHAMRALTAAIVPTTVAELRAIDVPSVVVMGTEDNTVGSGQRLAGLLGHATFRSIGGDHVQAGQTSAFGELVAEFLRA